MSNFKFPNRFHFVLPTVYENDPPAGDPPTPPTKTFTQAELEAAVNAERAKVQKTINDQLTQLKTLQQSSGLSAQEKKELQERIGQLESEVMTKEELARREQTQLKERYDSELKTAKESSSLWENRYRSATITAAITSAAADPASRAHDPGIFNVLLGPQAVLIEGKDAAGKPNGQFEVKIKKTKTEDGVVKELLFSPQDAIKLMQEDKTLGYLFRSDDTPGAGLSNSGNPNGGQVDIGQITDMKTYLKHRETLLG